MLIAHNASLVSTAADSTEKSQMTGSFHLRRIVLSPITIRRDAGRCVCIQTASFWYRCSLVWSERDHEYNVQPSDLASVSLGPTTSVSFTRPLFSWSPRLRWLNYNFCVSTFIVLSVLSYVNHRSFIGAAVHIEIALISIVPSKQFDAIWVLLFTFNTWLYMALCESASLNLSVSTVNK